MAFSVHAQTPNLVGYEYWFDQNDASRVFVPLAASSTVTLENAQLNTSGLSLGQHQVCLRWKDSPAPGQARWSSVVCRALNITQPAPWEITALRYWVGEPTNGTDPLVRTVNFDPAMTIVDFAGLLDLCQYPLGQQTLKLQWRDNHAQWSSVVTRPLDIVAAPNMSISGIGSSMADFCTGQTVTFTAAPVEVPGYALPTSYDWAFPSDWVVVSSDSNSTTVTIGTETGDVTVVGSNYCEQTATFTLNVADVTCDEEDCLGVIGGAALPGSPCDDQDPETENDTWSATCVCIGDPVVVTDCEGVVGGPALPGTSCDDGNEFTLNDTWSPGCDCVDGSGPVISIIDGGVATCSGSLWDSGGPGAAGYSNNESYILVVCSDASESAVSIDWSAFDLSLAGSSPADNISVYDGSDVSSPLLGTWNGTSNPGVTAASSSNPSGCLTIEFTSNEIGTGSFNAIISCTTPCEAPIAAAHVSGDPTIVCLNETVEFDGTASTAAPGDSLSEFQWNFGDGSQNSHWGPVVEHAYSESGTYPVNLVVVDDDGCESSNSIGIIVQVPDLVISGIAGPSLLEDNIEQTFSAITSSTDVASYTWTLPPGWSWGDDPSQTDATAIVLPDTVNGPFTICATAQVAGCTGPEACLSGIITGIFALNEFGHVNIYPNPSCQFVWIERAASDIAPLTIQDALGRVVVQAVLIGPRMDIPVDMLASGNYTLRWADSTGIHRHPISVLR